MDPDESFAKVVGRPPTGAERAWLERACATWNVRGNEGLLAVLLVLHLGAPGHKDYPRQCAEAVKHSVRAVLVPRVRRSPRVVGASSSFTVGELLAAFGMGTGGLVLVGLGTLALGTSPTMRWAGSEIPPEWLAPRILVPAMTTPAGWTLLLALATPALYAALWGWTRARDKSTARGTRLAGWTAFVLVNVTFWGCFAILY